MIVITYIMVHLSIGTSIGIYIKNNLKINIKIGHLFCTCLTFMRYWRDFYTKVMDK
jgi:hypothetical protein